MTLEIEPCPQAGTGVHAWIMRAAHTCRKAGMTPEQALREIESRITRRPAPASEIPAAVSKAYDSMPIKSESLRHWNTRPKWPPVDLAKREEIIASGFGLVDLWEASPCRLDTNENRTEQVISQLFPGNPLLCIGASTYEFTTAPRADLAGRLAAAQLIVPSPMLTRYGTTQEGKKSEHSLSNTGNRRFLVIEQDAGTPDEQAAVLFHLAQSAPLVLAVHSGSKSIHGWFYCQGRPEDKLEPFMRRAVALGADRATWIPSQFVRMPDGTRDNGNRQSIYFFNPQNIKL